MKKLVHKLKDLEQESKKTNQEVERLKMFKDHIPLLLSRL